MKLSANMKREPDGKARNPSGPQNRLMLFGALLPQARCQCQSHQPVGGNLLFGRHVVVGGGELRLFG